MHLKLFYIKITQEMKYSLQKWQTIQNFFFTSMFVFPIVISYNQVNLLINLILTNDMKTQCSVFNVVFVIQDYL